jgi:hypothetical protein
MRHPFEEFLYCIAQFSFFLGQYDRVRNRALKVRLEQLEIRVASLHSVG